MWLSLRKLVPKDTLTPHSLLSAQGFVEKKTGFVREVPRKRMATQNIGLFGLCSAFSQEIIPKGRDVKMIYPREPFLSYLFSFFRNRGLTDKSKNMYTFYILTSFSYNAQFQSLIRIVFLLKAVERFGETLFDSCVLKAVRIMSSLADAKLNVLLQQTASFCC